MKKILVGVTGGISAYKAVDVISALKKNGHHVSTIATPNALHFVRENVLEMISDKYWKEDWSSPIHIEASENVDIFCVVPATANTIAKFAHGIADNLLTDTYLALPNKTPKIIFPAMNSRMLGNDVFSENLRTIVNKYGWKVVPPVKGLLACGTEGIGKLPSTREIVEAINNKLKHSADKDDSGVQS